jgi:hypothetical protein
MMIRTESPVIAFDPGLMTGWAYTDTTGFHAGEGMWYGVMLRAEEWITTIARIRASSTPLIVCEDYRITNQTPKKTQQHYSLEQIGILRYLCMKHELSYEVVAASDAKTFATNDKLHKAGFWNVGSQGHANDAARHLLTALVRHHMIDPALLT